MTDPNPSTTCLLKEEEDLHLTQREVGILQALYKKYAINSADVMGVEDFILCMREMCTDPSSTINAKECECEDKEPAPTIPSWELVKTLGPTIWKTFTSSSCNKEQHLSSRGLTCIDFVNVFNVILKGNEAEKVRVTFRILDEEGKGYLRQEDLIRFLLTAVSDHTYQRLLGLNENSLSALNETTDYLVMALMDQEGSSIAKEAQSEALQLAKEWKAKLYALRAAKVARECFAKRNTAKDGKLLFDEFFQWTRDPDGANLMLWIPTFEKMEPYLFAEEGEALHDRFTCRGCGQSPIRGTRYTCKTCSHWHMCGLCVREGREPFSKQVHLKTHEFTEYPKALIIHWGFGCNGCDASPIVGRRFRCKECDDFDYCEECNKEGLEVEGHSKCHDCVVLDKAT